MSIQLTDQTNITELKEEYSKQDLIYYTPKEELINTLTHGVGVVAAIILLVFMLIKSTNVVSYAVSIISCLCLAIEFLISSLYHGTNKNLKNKRRLRTLDYPAVNLNVVACGSSLCLLYNQMYGYIAIGICLSITLLMLLLCLKNFTKFRKLSVGSTFIVGAILLVAYIIDKVITDKIPEISSFLYLAGLILCLIGAIIFRIKGIKYSHCIFHVFVLVGPIICMLANYYQLS